MSFYIPQPLIDRMTPRPADKNMSADLPRHGTTGQEWLDALARLFDKALRRWDLTLDLSSGGPRIHTGFTALVAEVLRQDGSPAALKLSWPFYEGAYEHIALRAWDGDGAVRLEAAEPKDYALLLERLDASRPLRGESILEACEVIGSLISRLSIPAPPQFATLIDEAKGWDDELAEPNPQVPRRLISQARSHLKDLVLDLEEGREPTNLLIHKDLHDENILAPLDTSRAEWIAIDPQCVAGEPAFAVAPIVWNRTNEIRAAYNARTHVRMKAEIVSDVAGLDEDRVRAWTFIRLVQNAVWAAQDSDDDQLTTSIFLSKMFDR